MIEADDLQTDSVKRWNVETSGWPVGYLKAYDFAPGPVETVMAMETPIVKWDSESATALPDGQIVFAFGKQIMWVDLQRHLAAGLAAGHAPVVVLDEQPPKQ